VHVQPQHNHLGIRLSSISMFSMFLSRFSIASSRSRIRFSSLPESSVGKSTRGSGQGFGQSCLLSGLLGNAGARADSSLFFFMNYTTVTLCGDVIRMLRGVHLLPLCGALPLCARKLIFHSKNCHIYDRQFKLVEELIKPKNDNPRKLLHTETPLNWSRHLNT